VLSEQEPAVIGAALLAAEGLGRAVDFSNDTHVETIEPDADWANFYDDHYDTHFERRHR